MPRIPLGTTLVSPVTASLLAALLAGCDPATAPAPGGEGPARAARASASRVTIAASGRGHYLLQGVADVRFTFTARKQGDGRARGAFHQHAVLPTGTYDFDGRVTCMSVDLTAGHAWIGGVVTANRSTDPQFRTPIHQVGKDVWFRVLDTGQPRGAGDGSSFFGFEGSAGFITSKEYCAGQPWPPNNARVWPLTEGNITVQ